MTNDTREGAEPITEAPGVSPAAVAHARWAVIGVFFLNGTLLATYTVRLPSLKQHLHLSDGRLGVILTLFGAAALLTMQFVGPLVARFGSAWIIRIALVVLPFTLFGVGLAGGFGQLAVAVVLMGMVHGTLDVAMNAHAVAVERLRGRPVMNSCHASWSVSAVVASLLGGAVIRAGVSPRVHLIGVGIALIIAGLLVTIWLLPVATDRVRATAPDGGRARAPRVRWTTGWTRAVLIFGTMGFIVMVCEAAAISWSGIFLHENRDATLAVAALGYTAFTACQTAGRLVGDRLGERLGAKTLFRLCGLVALVGLGVVLLIPSPITTIAGFAILGLGDSVMLPLIFSAVGHAGGEGPGAATFLSRFTTFTYAGLLIGPALVGWCAEATGLPWTLAGLCPLLLLVIWNSRVMPAANLAHSG